MKNGLFIILFLFLIFDSQAQQELYLGSARIGGLAGITSPVRGEEAVWANPAALANLSSLSMMAFVENRFGVQGLGTQSFGIGLPVSSGAFGLSYGSFGFDSYRQSRLTASYGMSISESSHLGLGISWYNTRVSDLSRSRISAHFGGMIGLGKSLNLGFLVLHPFDLFEEANQEIELPAEIKIGLGYEVSEGLNLYAELDKIIDRKESLRFGLEYWFFEKVCTRWGYGIDPGLFTFGIGVKLGSFRLDFAGSSHQYLGFSPQFSALWKIPEKSKP